MKSNLTTELRKIADGNNGILMPEAVIHAARPKDSPLHSQFEWNNSKAAHAHRLWQARHLIRVCVEMLPKVNVPTEVFVSLRSDRENGGYRVQAEVLSDKDMRQELLSDALAELRMFSAKYQRLKELASVFRAISGVLKKAG